eukprot:514396-Alexandrium_andersonii.AAC.1
MCIRDSLRAGCSGGARPGRRLAGSAGVYWRRRRVEARAGRGHGAADAAVAEALRTGVSAASGFTRPGAQI